MIAKIEPEELEMMQCFHYPVSFMECLFSDYDNMAQCNEKLAHVRDYQIPMLSFESFIDTDNVEGLGEKEKFKLKKGAGDCFNFAGRKIGKTILTKLDIPYSMVHNPGWPTAIYAPDAVHLAEVLDDTKNVLESHPIFSEWRKGTKGAPAYVFTSKNGWKMKGVNLKLKSKSPGSHFFGLHVKRLWGEEASSETQEVFEVRKESVSEIGAIMRLCIAEGTKVLMADFSSKNIEDIKIGDKIVAWNEKARCLEETDVTGFFDSGKRDVIKIDNKKSDLWLTPEHKIRIKTQANIRDKSPGTPVYRWREAHGALTETFYADSLSYVAKEEDYYRGMLVGLIESDGHCEIKQGKEKVLKQYRLFQSNEVKFFKFILDYFSLKYSEDIRSNERKGVWAKIDKPLHVYRLSTQSNDFIEKIYNDLNVKKEVQLGFLAGFIIGDGHIGNSGSLELSQCAKNKDKIDLIVKAAKKLNVKYHLWETKEQSRKYRMRFPKYSLILPTTTKKGQKYKNKILNTKRPVFSPSRIKVKGFKEQVQVYDIKTKLNSFIANGFIVHNSGMTNFTRQMPIGQEFYNPKNRNKIVNLPQMVNPFWDEEEKKDRIDFYGAESSPNFLIFVLGEIIEDGLSEFDIERVNVCLNKRRKIKRFEINKDRYPHFKDLIVLDRPTNIDRIFCAGDIGDGAGGSDITIFSEKDINYKLLYNIVLTNITEPEQLDFFKWLIEEMQINVLSLDCGDACGRGLYHSLIKANSEYKKNLVWYHGNSKVVVGYEKDEKGELIIKGGKPVEREEFMKEWSVRRLKSLLYNERLDIPADDAKFISQINSVMSSRSGTRVKYICPSPTGDHYFDSFRVFSIGQWLKADFNDTKPMSQNWGVGVTG